MMTTNPASRQRLTPADRRKDLFPWRKAESLTRCHLYWLPAEFPNTSQQRQWLLAFLEAFSSVGREKLSLQPQMFLQMKTVYPDLLNDFIKTSMEFNPLFGLSRRPAAAIPKLPDMNYVQDLQQGRTKFKFGDKMADYCYWFIGAQEQRQRQLFLGFGGTTTIFIKPDPNTTPPKPISIPAGVRRSPIFEDVLKSWDPAQGQKVAYALKGDFLKKSKEFFGRGLEEDPQYPGLVYVLPLLCAEDFMAQPDEEANHWFEVFEIYINESPVDRGVLLASKEDCDEHLKAILLALKQKGLQYPGDSVA